MQWISVDESLPQVNYDKLLLLSSGAISTGYLSKRRPICRWVIHNPEEAEFKVTHWMSLPEPLKDIGHHCKKGPFTCFRSIGEKELTLSVPKNILVEVTVCPFCGGRK